ncbi:glycosyltransferase [Acidisoma sp. C75]
MMRGLINEANLASAIVQRDAWGVPLSEVLAALFRVSGHSWAQSLAEATGLPLADLRQNPPDMALLAAEDRDLYLQHLFIPWRMLPGKTLVIAAREPEDPALLPLLEARWPGLRLQFAVTGKFDVIWAVQRCFDDVMSEEAREALFRRSPQFSAKITFSASQRLSLLLVALTLLLALVANAKLTLMVISALLSALYALLFLFRAGLTVIGSSRRVDLTVSATQLAALREEDLPVFSVLVPMYREAEVLPILVESLRRIDYPRAKLDVKLVLEAKDDLTINAAKALGAEDLFEIIRVPDSHPKTKPKACNYALRFARGEFTVIYDAEDIPEPDQLRKVVALFRAASPDVACVQARLNYFNRADNFLTRMFTLEYSHWFDYLLPGLHTLNIPIPLGGTSNHFRTDVLVALGAWDPYNVTEDADLGVRLTQAGYRVAIVNSTTFEEANGVLPSWINQRSRWIKGYMQTWLVHMRQPVALYRRLGFLGFLGFQMFVGFPPFTALLNPLLWLTSLFALVIGPQALHVLFPPATLTLSLFDLLIGNAMYVYFNIVAASKRGWFDLVPWGLLAPIYWVLHSVAAYKALWQLVLNPHYWEKTQHGTSGKTQEVLAMVAAGYAPPDAAAAGAGIGAKAGATAP